MRQKQSEVDSIMSWIGFLINAVVWILVLMPAIFLIWGKNSTYREAIDGFWGFELMLGGQKRSLGLMMTGAIVFYCIFLGSWLLQDLIASGMFIGQHVEWGVRVSIARLINYFLLFAGLLLVIWILGFDFTKLVIVISALGVGIGFGLQSIVNNFISGLILLFERPIRVGDSLEINGMWVEVKKIGLRSTTVRSVEEADLIIPNAELVNNSVTNWTLSNRRVRVKIPVGVAYKSDVSLVMETLLLCSRQNRKVVETPAPQVLFISFGESALNFELRVWVANTDDRLEVCSDLHKEIDRRFREAKIEIAYPQRDIHLKSLNEEDLAKA